MLQNDLKSAVLQKLTEFFGEMKLFGVGVMKFIKKVHEMDMVVTKVIRVLISCGQTK